MRLIVNTVSAVVLLCVRSHDTHGRICNKQMNLEIEETILDRLDKAMEKEPKLYYRTRLYNRMHPWLTVQADRSVNK